ncbi:MAG: TonB-dependent receptor [Betaproteobacteria bacterium]
MKFQRKKLAGALAYALGAGGAFVLAGTSVQAADIKVDVTGSSIRRVEAEGALPVTVITREEIGRTGAINAEQLLQTVAVLSSLSATQLSMGAGLSTYGQSSISMRGLGSYRTLVLVNGRRLSPFAGDDGASVNVNSIPIAAIERIEVLRDGASAVYGSDAIAGVVNFILTKSYRGAEAGVTYGSPTRSGGGDSTEVHAVAGWGDLDKDRYNVSISANYQKEKALFAKNRNFAKTGNVFPYLVAGATGQGNIEGAFTPGTGSAAAGTWVEGSPQTGKFGASPGSGFGNPLAPSGNCADINMFVNPSKSNKGASYCAFDSSGFVGLLPDRDSTNVSGSFTFKINNNIEAFADALYAKQTVKQEIQASPVRRSFLQSDTLFETLGIDPALLIYPNNPNYAIAANYLQSAGYGSLVGQPLAITSRVFDFGPRTSEDDATQWRAVAGLRGTWGNHDWEAAYTHNENKVEGHVIAGYFSQTAYAQIVQSSNDWNPWSLQQTAAFDAKLPAAAYIGPTLTSTAKSDSVDGKISGEIFNLPAGPLLYALGAQWRREEIDAVPSPALGTGDIAGLGGSVPPVTKNRRDNAMFGELNIPIVKSVEGSVAVRYDDYSDVGGTTNYYASLRWQPTRQLLLRTAYGTGFRAPTLFDLYQPVTLGTSEQFTDPFTTQANLQVNAFSGGNPNLKPETSTQWSVGVVWQPVRQVNVGLDYWQVKLKDIISTPSAQEVVTGFRNGDATYANSVVLNSGGEIETITTQIVNAGTATVEGIDVNLSFRDSFSWGDVGVSMQGAYIQKFDQTSPGGVVFHKVGTLVDQNGDPVIGATDTGGVVIRWKHVLSGTYAYRNWAFTLTQNFYSGYETAPRQIDGERNFVGGQSIFDVQVAYTGIKNLRLAVGSRNVFDKDPPIYVPVSNQFQAGYDVAQYDPRARYVYGSMSYKFF